MKREKNIDEKIHDERVRANELLERCEAIPKEIAELEQTILCAEEESSISTIFEQIDAKRREQREKRLLARRSEIQRLKYTCEKLKAAIAQKRDEWQREFDKLPEAVEALEVARQALEMQEQIVKKIEGTLASEEKSLLAHEHELNVILTQSVPLN